MAKPVAVTTAKPIPKQDAGRHSPPSFMFRPVRTRLLDELQTNAKERAKILSIVAPIGYGKTVLMSELHAHLQQAGEHCCWVGLDDRHSSADRVLSALKDSLIEPTVESQPIHALFRGDEPMENRIDELVELIARLPDASTIFIDNLNTCSDESLGTVLDALIFRTPSSARFVWSSTTELSINLGRAKLERLIRQIGFSELSLDANEAREMLGTDADGDIGTSGIETIMRQTEGWPAAIRMAQIILTESGRPLAALESFSGSDEDVAALLNRQVLKGFSPELREFLFSLAQLRTFSAKLCRHVTQDSNAERHLDFLLRRNVFIIPLDRNRKQYRLHGLFREYLLGEADRALSKQQKCEILERAAEWCEQNENWHDAIDYALSANAKATAALLLDRTAKVFVREQGDVRQYVEWAERLQAEGGQIGWETHFWYVWALVFQRRYEYALQQLERLAERLRQSMQAGVAAEDLSHDDLSQRVGHLRACLELLMDRLDDSCRGAEQWLATKRTDDPYNTSSVGCIKSVSLASAFKFTKLREAMRIAEPIMLEVGGPYSIAWISIIYGTASIYEGDYAHAYRELLAGLSRARRGLGNDAVICDTMAFTAAKCAVEMGLNDEARELLVFGLRTVQGNALVDTTASGFDAAVKLWNGGTNEFISIPRLREVARGYPPRLSLMLACYLVQRLLRLGRVKEALAEAERIGLSPERQKIGEPKVEEGSIARYRDLYAATSIDLLIATKKFDQAELLINRESRLARAEGRAARLVDLGLAKAEIAMLTGDSIAAAKALTSALSRASGRRIVRPFHDRAAVVSKLVSGRKASSWSFAVAEEREFFAEICSSLNIKHADHTAPSKDSDAASQPVVTPTTREAELLSLLETGLSNQQIADQANISVSTIKWHLKNLYRKFGVSNRTAVLARVRASRSMQ